MVLLSVLSGAYVWRLRVSSFSELDWFACHLQRAEFLRKGSHEGPLFRMFPLALQSIISNQMRPWKLRRAWYSRLLRHPARRRSGSILSPGTHTGCRQVLHGHPLLFLPPRPKTNTQVQTLPSSSMVLCDRKRRLKSSVFDRSSVTTIVCTLGFIVG